MVEKAMGKNYFDKSKLPLFVARVNHSQGISHNFDLTEIPHYHDFTEIIIVLKGKALHLVENNEYQVSAGDIFVLQGYQAHSFKDASQIEIVNVMFDAREMNKLFNTQLIRQIPGYKALFILEPQYRNNYHFKNILHLGIKDLSHIELIISSMITEQSNMEPAYEAILKNRLEELIIFLSREYSKLNSKEAVSLLRIGHVMEYIENSYSKNISLEELAQISNMSVRNFQRIFKNATGDSPIDYLIKLRLEKAKKMLQSTDFQVADIALRTGFNEYNYFSRKFKNQIGLSPLKYRFSYKK
ncbi:MAG: AraC family transcriptional regulator [Bacteroidales bacterium]